MHPESTPNERICEHCGARFRIKPSQLRRGRGRFCSRECANSGRVTKRMHTCLNCGTEFVAHVSAKRKYCSQSCRTSHHNRASARPLVDRACLECGTTFQVLETSPKKYCSHACSTAHQYGASVEARFWSKVDRRSPDECWEWQAGRKHGYGAFHFRGALWQASRVAWTLTHGEIPDELWILHECDNPPCCNPAHLFLGTPSDNSADRDAKHRHYVRFGSRHGLAKLNESDVREIRRRYTTGDVLLRELAEEFGVTFTNISLVVRRETWKHVD